MLRFIYLAFAKYSRPFSTLSYLVSDTVEYALEIVGMLLVVSTFGLCS